jgi:methylenetetrahydrofolate reductase (NADPH)
VPGVHIPDELVDRLDKAGPPKAARLEGKRICVEMIQRVRAIPGIKGVHVMAYRQEELVSEVIQESGVLAGRRARRVRALEQEEGARA